jgi:hypothetical protein
LKSIDALRATILEEFKIRNGKVLDRAARSVCYNDVDQNIVNASADRLGNRRPDSQDHEQAHTNDGQRRTPVWDPPRVAAKALYGPGPRVRRHSASRQERHRNKTRGVLVLLKEGTMRK